MLRRGVLLACAIALLAPVAGCSSAPAKPKPLPAPTGALRLGYTTGLADAPVLAGLQLGIFSSVLGQVTLAPTPFGSTAAETLALERGQLDAAYLDPMAAVALWQQGRTGIKILAGVASGGAELVVRPGITSARQLAHAAVAAPAGSAQEVALDYWLRQNGVASNGPANDTMTSAYLAGALKSGRLAGAWEPAPVDAQMTAAGGHVLVDEASLWPGGRFATSVLVVTDGFLARHSAAVGLLLRGQVQAIQFTATDRSAAEHAVNLRLTGTAGPALPPGVLDQAFNQLRFSVDPLADSILGEAQHAVVEGLLSPIGNLDGLFDLGPLNAQLKASGLHQVRS